MNRTKLISCGVGLLVVIVAALAAYNQPRSGQAMKNTPLNSGATSGALQVASSTYSLTDVARHNDRSSCWTVVRDGVYDLTTWIDRHPGGEAAILSLCGTDGSSAFMNQHGGERRPEQELASLRIGNLAN